MSGVLYQYAQDHDRFSEQEQLYRLRGHEIEAAGAKAYAGRALRAWLAESDDPEPKPDDWTLLGCALTGCHPCRAYLATRDVPEIS